MKKLFMCLVFLSTMAAEAQSKKDVTDFFVKQTSDSKSAIFKKLDTVRKAKVNGFLREEANIIPLKITAKDLSLLLLDSEHYMGKRISETEVDPGYVKENYLISVMAHEVWYGGRINLQSAVLFECSYSKYENESKSEIECNVK